MMVELAARLLFPMSLMLGAGLLAKSYGGVGDGFSAGAVAGLGAVVQYVCLEHEHASRVAGARWAVKAVVGGLLLIVALLLGPALFGVPPVTHLPRPSGEVVKLGVLELHTSLLFDLGVAVVVYGAMVATFDHLFPAWRSEEE